MLWAICCYPSAMAQRITRQYNNVSFAAALKDLNVAQDKYAINFVYNELEDFKVTKSIHNMSVPDAIRQLIGFYPIKMTQLGNTIIVECTQKAPTKMTGRIIDARHRPIEYANVCLLNARDSSFITGGTTNEDGQFVIPCEENAAIVKVSCVGYTTVCHTYGTGAIGTIALKEATISLQKVVVKGHHKIYKTDGTNLIVDIQRSSLSDFGNADEVVAQLPTVSGSDGSYTVFGRGRAEVYIGNRRLRNNSELSRLNSRDISTVEIISNPGVEYDADTHKSVQAGTLQGLSHRILSIKGDGHWCKALGFELQSQCYDRCSLFVLNKGCYGIFLLIHFNLSTFDAFICTKLFHNTFKIGHSGNCKGIVHFFVHF